ncbi:MULTISPECIES: TetR/AcrR family transcriptional regulator [unclassified Halomonas]|jgi:AcrR family transcriptional regulator|uniref:TetR/AcrR family transcriptional regulator n=1 Tax=unclassified Halomonas TaxID=2609666 RepID=UPI001CF2D932|nr:MULTISPECIES: TetR/AcrR family transcriptional regulator [unclassified Halomonas]MCA8863508.1 TetR/AcrR family transcriptional regulator [Halomonas sp. SBBP1]UZH08826.1 TetR/AcrR family transcriptional regulator [Halomonas sp. BDJS001]
MTKRQNQEERSRQTQARVTQATIECILEKGIRATSTVDVARLAGVSRGALVHHYPSKTLLMQAALEDLLSREVESVREMAVKVKAGELNFDSLLKALHEHFKGDLYMVTLEYLTNARTDPDIMKVLVPLAAKFNDSLEQIWEQLVASSKHTSHQNRVALNATLCMMRGMGAQSIWRDDPELYRDMLLFWKETLLELGFSASDAKRSEPA